MELVDENEGYDSEEDNDYSLGSSQGESKARVIDFIKPQELQPFSLGSSNSQQPNASKKKTSAV